MQIGPLCFTFSGVRGCNAEQHICQACTARGRNEIPPSRQKHLVFILQNAHATPQHEMCFCCSDLEIHHIHFPYSPHIFIILSGFCVYFALFKDTHTV